MAAATPRGRMDWVERREYRRKRICRLQLVDPYDWWSTLLKLGRAVNHLAEFKTGSSPLFRWMFTEMLKYRPAKWTRSPVVGIINRYIIDFSPREKP
jgi:hypothetical protein